MRALKHYLNEINLIYGRVMATISKFSPQIFEMYYRIERLPFRSESPGAVKHTHIFNLTHLFKTFGYHLIVKAVHGKNRLILTINSSHIIWSFYNKKKAREAPKLVSRTILPSPPGRNRVENYSLGYLMSKATGLNTVNIHIHVIQALISNWDSIWVSNWRLINLSTKKQI